MRWFAGLFLVAACSDAPALDAREQRIVTVLAEDNYMWARRDPSLVAMKLTKMQRGPYEWLRGTATLFWRDVMEPGTDRATTSFDDAASARVLLVGDPHPENIGTYRAADGTMLLDWNDFDGAGYGPFTGDVRRLVAGLTILSLDTELAPQLATAAVTAYAATITKLAAGTAISPIGRGRSELFDDELDKAETRGKDLFAIDELAPITNGVRVLAVGELEPIADDGVFEDHLTAVGIEESQWLDAAIAQWSPNHLPGDAARIKLRARRVGSGVASYPAYRYNVVLEGATTAPEDDRVVELKETRDGLIIDNVPRWMAAEWNSPAARAVDTQRRLQARRDNDLLLGSALVGALAMKIRDRESFQRGINASDLTELAQGSANDHAELVAIATVYGELLARAHGNALTEDGVRGWTVIAPLLAGRDAQFVSELSTLGAADAALTIADHTRMANRDLSTLILPQVVP